LFGCFAFDAQCFEGITGSLHSIFEVQSLSYAGCPLAQTGVFQQ
jgi:hypothetical protein